MSSLAQSNQEGFYRLFSSEAVTKYLIEEFFGSISYEDGDWIDIHDKRVMTLLKLSRTMPINYNAGLPVTTHSVHYYKTSSLWWLIVACSDFVHPHQIPNNTIIYAPSFADISTAFKEVYTGLRNQVVTI